MLFCRLRRIDGMTQQAMELHEIVSYAWIMSPDVFSQKKFLLQIQVLGNISPFAQKIQTTQVLVPDGAIDVHLSIRNDKFYPEVLVEFSGMIPPGADMLCHVIRGFLAAVGFLPAIDGDRIYKSAKFTEETCFNSEQPVFGDTRIKAYSPVHGSIDGNQLENYLNHAFKQHFSGLKYEVSGNEMHQVLIMDTLPGKAYRYTCPCGGQRGCNGSSDFSSSPSCPN